MAPPLAPSSQEPAPTASVLVEVRLPPQVALHRLASPLVGLEHDVVGLVGEPRPAVLDGEPRAPRWRAASPPKGTTVGCSLSTAPPAAVHAGRPPASTATSGNPMRRSHEAVITERAKPSQTRTIDAARTATYSSVACTAW